MYIGNKPANCDVNYANVLIFFQIEMPAGLGFSNAEYYPYVYYKLNIDMISSTTSLL